MEEIKIEKGIEISIRREKTKYPFSDMEIGDSFYVDVTKNSTKHKTQSMLFSAARIYVLHSKLDVKYATRTWNEGIRIWRIK